MSQPLGLLTTAIGLGAVTVGTLSSLFPDVAPQIYGIPTRQIEGGRSSEGDAKLSLVELDVLLHSLNIRNFVTGLSVLALTAFWQQTERQSPEQADAVRSCLGIIIVIGGITPAIDAYGAWRAAPKRSTDGLAYLAAMIHALRCIVWVVGGIWCLNS